MSHLTPNSRPVHFTQVQITSVFWVSRINTTRERALPIIWQRLKETGRWDVLRLKWKPGMPNRPHHFWDSDVAKWTEAACYSLTSSTVGSNACCDYHREISNSNQPCTTNETDAFLTAKVAEAASLIQNAQWSDGYINSYFTVVEPRKRWTNVAWSHEMYCAGHLLEAAIAHDDYTKGSGSLIGPLIKYVNHIDRKFGPNISRGQQAGYPGHQEIELALMRLHEHLCGSHSKSSIMYNLRQRIVSLVSFFIHERGKLRNGVHFYDYEAELRNNDPPAKPGPAYPTAPPWAYNQADAPISELQSVEGHSVRAGYWLTGAAHLARVTQDEHIFQNVKRLWSSMTERRMHITGGLGAMGDWEGFGPDYYFPNESAYAETCASVALIFFAHQMILAHPTNVKYGDVLERALYNGALAGMSLDGKTFFYENPLATVGKWRERSSWFEVSCCPPNLARLLMSLGKYIYTQSTMGGVETVHVHLLIGSKAELVFPGDKGINITQISGFPRNANFIIQLAGTAVETTNLTVRVPDWAPLDEVQTTMNGYRVSFGNTGRILQFTPISKSSKYQINIDIPLKAQFIYPHPLDTENHASVAISRGPFVYCAETVDNPEVDDLRMIRVPKDMHFDDIDISFPGAISLVGLKGAASVVALDQESADGWVLVPKDGDSDGSRNVTIVLIPFFAWANRGRSDVRVWLPREIEL